MSNDSLLRWLSNESSTEQTKSASYQNLVSTELLGAQQLLVFEWLGSHPLSSYEDINKGLFNGKKINVVCGRMNELRKMDLVSAVGFKVSEETGQKQVLWVLNGR